MKKIMFSDKFGLTEAVLQGRKTMTRRIIRNLSNFDPRQEWMQWGVNDKGKANIAIFHIETYKYSIYPQYQPGEVVAVAQRGIDIYHALQKRYGQTSDAALGFKEMYEGMPMWNNKMFVPVDLCPSRIRITDIKVERLQDISEEDCLKEGVCIYTDKYGSWGYTFTQPKNVVQLWNNKRVAFSHLIDKVSGKGTWERNPRVFAYSFELV